MRSLASQASCGRCSCHIRQNMLEHSVERYNIPLCGRCQQWFKHQLSHSTCETVSLYLSLLKRRVNASLEKSDGYKTVDITVMDAKIHIEVDGLHHNTDPKQAFADLQRMYHSLRDGFITLRIPKCLVREKLEQTANYITQLVVVDHQQYYYKFKDAQRNFYY